MGLFAAVLELAGATVRLAAKLVERGAQAVARREAPQRPGLGSEAAQKRPAAPSAAEAPSTDEKLVGALVGLGFAPGSVRKYAATVRGRQAPLDVLVKNGIAALTN
jgi:Holliday junction resolvasome RuvABC DNA-binding subunit